MSEIEETNMRKNEHRASIGKQLMDFKKFEFELQSINLTEKQFEKYKVNLFKKDPI